MDINDSQIKVTIICESMISILIIICKFSVHFFGRRNIRGHQTGETVPRRRKKPHADTRMGKFVSEWVNIVNLLQD